MRSIGILPGTAGGVALEGAGGSKIAAWALVEISHGASAQQCLALAGYSVPLRRRRASSGRVPLTMPGRFEIRGKSCAMV